MQDASGLSKQQQEEAPCFEFGVPGPDRQGAPTWGWQAAEGPPTSGAGDTDLQPQLQTPAERPYTSLPIACSSFGSPGGQAKAAAPPQQWQQRACTTRGPRRPVAAAPSVGYAAYRPAVRAAPPPPSGSLQGLHRGLLRVQLGGADVDALLARLAAAEPLGVVLLDE